VTIDKQGRVEAAFADGCIKTCVTDSTETSGAGPADAQAATATIARQSSGIGLFSAYDPQPNLTLSRQTVTQTKTGFADALVVKNTGTTAVNGFATAVYDNGKLVGTKTTTLAAGQSATLTFTWKATGGSHTITGVVDPADKIAESNEGDNKAATVLRK
jgi:subtilase family serine protease